MFGHDEAICRWVSYGLSGNPDFINPSLAKAIGFGRDGKVIAGTVYNNQHCRPDGTPYTIEISIYSIDKRWATRQNLHTIFAYPFVQLRLERLQANCSAQNEGVLAFMEKIGFKREGIHRRAWHSGGDTISFSMMPEECRWIHGK